MATSRKANKTVSDSPNTQEFAKRLDAAVLQKGWSYSDLARRAEKFLNGKTFGRDNVSRYKLGKSLPNPLHLTAMAKALGMQPSELLPGYDAPRVKTTPYDFAGDPRPFSLEAREEGDAWLRINTNVPLDLALEILKLIKESKSKEAAVEMELAEK